MTVAVEARALTKRFGEVLALDALDLEVRAGEVLGYLGPNGAGKSTTIRLLLDLLRPTAGQVRVLGGTGADPGVRARIGYLPAELRVDPRHSARDAVELVGALRGTGLRGNVDRARAWSLADRFGLDVDRPFGELSTGNRRKLATVLAFAHEPELLVLDEPTSGLDPLLQEEFRRLVTEAVAGGATVLLSSHVLPEVELLADRVAVLRRGRLVATWELDELRARGRQRIELRLDHDVTAEAFDRVPGLVGLRVDGAVVDAEVEGSVGPLLRRAAELGVRRITTHEIDLEDLFRDLYEDADGRG